MKQVTRLLVALLFSAGGATASAQSDNSIEKSIVSVSGSNTPYSNSASRALLINDKGVVLTTWRNICMPGKLQVSANGLYGEAKLIGVHPTRDLAIVQAEAPKNNPNYSPKPAKMASTGVGVGDQVFVCRWNQPMPALVSSDTQPVGNPEYFWMTGRDPKSGSPFPGGWGSNYPQADDWIMNLKGEILGTVARVVVNGQVVLRVIPVHDVKVEDFVPLSRRKPNVTKAQELIQMADQMQKDREKGRYRPVPFGTYEPDVTEYLRMALAEDPENKEVLFRLGVVGDNKPAVADPSKENRSLPDLTKGKSNDQVDTEFIRSRVNMAIEHLKGGRTKLGEGILKDVVETYPNHPEARTAKQLLESLNPPKK